MIKLKNDIMKNKILTLFTIFLIVTNVFSQENNEEAFMNAIRVQDTNKAIESFEKIENRNLLSSDVHFHATLAYLKNGDEKNAINQLRIASTKGLSGNSIFEDGSLIDLEKYIDYKSIKEKVLKNSVIASEEFKKLKEKLRYKFVKPKKSVLVDLRSEMTPVKSQGNRNTCSAFAATSIAEYVVKKDKNKALDFSEAYNYYISKTKALNNDFLKTSYGNIDGLCGYLALEGYSYNSMQESEWTYESQNWLMKNDERCKTKDGMQSLECFTGLPSTMAKTENIQLETVFIPLDKISDFIMAEKRPVIVNIWILTNGMDSKTGALTIPTKGEEIRAGGHVVAITGYDPDKQEYTFKNSWGEQWGNKGYGTMSKAYLETHFESSMSLPFNLDVADEEKEFYTKATMGASAYVRK